MSAFIVALFVGSIVLPGFKRDGQPLRDGSVRPYKLSGLVLFVATHVAIAAGVLLGGWSLTPLLTHFWSVFVVANLWAVVITLYLFFEGRRRPVERSGPLPAVLHDLWFGPELNPTLAGVDLKMFMYHPSLIGLAVMNAAFAFAQFETYGALSAEMVLYQGFTWAYLFTHYLKEHFMLSTWDIIAEHFGFMLTWGDLVYVPFLYSLVGWWVLPHGWVLENGTWRHEAWPLWALASLLGFHVFSHWVFRGSNWQKDRFKRDPNALIWGKKAETLGGKLLVSGWWGIGRKINYTGEIGVYLSFALCAGFDSPWPYVLPGTLVVLLTQRAWRDDQRCRTKYGALWDAYCARARFRIFPLIY
ncbi:MAG: hypothetical protein AAGE52_04150 [Myxococcota bacterium]